MTPLVALIDDGNLCGECPVWDAGTHQLYWTDSGGLKFYTYDWSTRRRKLIKEGLEINGFTLNQSGGFVVANDAGVWLWDGADTLRLLADHVDDSACRMNDCIADPTGRVLAGSCFYDPASEYMLGKLICVDTNGKLQILDEGFHLANGLGFSPDNKKLYFADSAARLIYAYDYDPASGIARNRHVFVKVPVTEGIPDGLTVDAEGFVWSAQWYGSRVVRYDPDGKVERCVDIPAKQPSSLAFGGPDLTDIFITSAAKSEPLPLMPEGYDSSQGCFGGALYHINLGIRGKAEFKARINSNV